MSAAPTELVAPDTLAVLRAAGEHLAVLTDGGFDADAALGDIDALRGLVNLLAGQPAVRAGLRPAHEHPLLAPDPTTADQAAANVLTEIKTRAAEARKAERAERRGTAEERRIARLEADLAKARRDRALALERADEASRVIDALRAQNDELEEALRAETRRADLNAATSEARLDTLSNARALARHLRAALEQDDDLLTAAALALPDEHREQATAWVPLMLDELANPRVARAQLVAQALSVEMLGGGTEVGGSCALVSGSSTRILVDAGIRPGARSDDELPPPRLRAALDAGPIDGIVLTHAHADHIGWVPAIVAAHPDTPIYTTRGTAELLPAMWTDSARIYRDRDTPPYSEDDVQRALAQVSATPFNRPVQIGDLTISLFPAGHILGAAGVHLTDGIHRVVISGDVSGPGQQTVGGWHLPDDAKHPDLLVLESTYGAAPPSTPRARVVQDFVRDVSLTVSNGGTVLVPAFAIGRAQEIAMICAEHLPGLPVRIDGLARDITTLYEQHNDPAGHPISVYSDAIQPVRKGHTSRAVETFNGGVVITTSGMLNAGPAVRWARRILPDPRSSLAIVGYQDPNSPGGRLLKMTSGERIELPDGRGTNVKIDINATVRQYGLGAHASSDELVTIATQVRAGTTMLVHGDPDARAALETRLRARHLDTTDAATTWRALS